MSLENIDAITNHRTRESGNTVFVSVPVVEPVEDPTIEPREEPSEERAYRWYTATAEAQSVREIKAQLTPGTIILARLHGDRWVLAESTIVLPGFPDLIEPERLREPVSPLDSINIRGLIEKETNKLNVLSDGIGLALLAVLHKHGSMSLTTILENLEMQREDLASHLSILETNQLVVIEEEQYFVTGEGLAFLSDFGLVE